MKIAYIFVRFPIWSETFAVNDVVEMSKNVDKLDIYNLRRNDLNDFEFRGFNEVKENIKLADLKTFLIGLWGMFSQIGLFSSWFYWLISKEVHSISSLIKCLVLGPQAFYILKKIREENYDIVHLFWGHFPAMVGFLIKESRLPVKLSMFLGAYDLELGLNISTSVANRADFLWSHAHYNSKKFKSLGIDTKKLNIVYRGVNKNYFSTILHKKDLKKIVSVGRMIKEKSFDDTIKILEQLRLSAEVKLKNTELHLIGTGPEEENLKKLTQERGLDKFVFFHGKVDHQKVLDIFKDTNIFLFPSRYEGDRLPNVVKEAMGMGCVNIVTDTHGIEELVDDGVNGFIFPKGDLDKAFDLIKLVYEKEDLTIIRRAAIDKVLQDFTVQASSQKYLDIWKRES